MAEPRRRDRVAMPPVMNQGKFGTCVAYAFAAALSQGLLNKYGVAANPTFIV